MLKMLHVCVSGHPTFLILALVREQDFEIIQNVSHSYRRSTFGSQYRLCLYVHLYCMPGFVLRHLTCDPFELIKTLQDRYYYPHFSDVATKSGQTSEWSPCSHSCENYQDSNMSLSNAKSGVPAPPSAFPTVGSLFCTQCCASTLHHLFLLTCEATMAIISILQLRKLIHQEISHVPEATQLVSGRLYDSA